MKYSITTARGFTGPRRQRLGGLVNVQPGFPQIVELKDEELAVVSADPMLVIEEVKEEVKETKKSKPKTAPKDMVDEPEAKEL